MTTIDEDRQLLRDFKRLRRRLRKDNNLTTFIRMCDWPYFNKDQKRAYFNIANNLNWAQDHVDDIITELKKTIRYKETNHGDERE